jgi:transcriptional regulator with XRE-family HTH domain
LSQTRSDKVKTYQNFSEIELKLNWDKKDKFSESSQNSSPL